MQLAVQALYGGATLSTTRRVLQHYLPVTQGFYGIIDLVVAALLDFAHLNQSCLNSMCVQLYNKKTVG